MITRWTGWLLLLLSVGAASQETPRQLKFSAAEQQIWQLTLQRPVGEGKPTLATLNSLGFNHPAQQALLWAQRCRFALQHGDKAALDSARTALKALENAVAPGEFAGSAAGYKCQQISKFAGGESAQTHQLSFLAYHSLTEHDVPALHAWIGLDYARDALTAGFADSAANAVALVLNIARQNQLPQLEADGLAVQSAVQSAQGQYPEALRSIGKALELTTDPADLARLTLVQADVLHAAGRGPEAQQLYQTLWQQQQSLPAGLALLAMQLQQGKADAALALGLTLQQAASQNGNREWVAISRLRYAMALLIHGQTVAAQALFSDSSGWLMQHRLALYLPEQQRWAQLLVQHGQLAAAVAALQHSLQLQRQLDADNYHAQAQLSSTLLIAEQRSRELKLLELQQQLQASRMAADASAAQIWPLSLLAAALAALLLLLIWRRVSPRGNLTRRS